MITRQSGKDLQEALREAFQAAGRCLEDHVRKSRGYVKQHADSQKAWVLRVFPGSGYGFLEDTGGREIYFHRNSVVNGSFDALAPGAKVQFTEESGLEGPQASIVVVQES
jgi:cold shock CspA family protein